MENLIVPLKNMSVYQIYRKKYEPWTDFLNMEAERYTLIVYYILAFISATAGNLIILTATTKYKAIKLDEVTNTLIQHLAVSDIGNATFGILPSLITLIMDKWIFGSLFCSIITYIRMVFYYSSVFLICSLNICKLTLLLFPMQARNWSKIRGHIAATSAWSIFILFQLFALIFKKFSPIFFEYRIMSCWYLPADLGIGYGLSVLIFLGLLGYLPILIVLGSTLGLLFVAARVAKRRRSTVQWQGVVTVLSIAGIYILTYLPFIMYHTIYNYIYINPNESGMSSKAKSVFYLQLFTITNALAYLNNTANIFIYFISIASFKKFILTKFASIISIEQQVSSNAVQSTGAGSVQQSSL